MSRTLTGISQVATGAALDPFDSPVWRAVLGRVEDAHPFLSPVWQRAWWSHLGSGRLAVLELGAGGAGVAAVRVGRDGAASFLGDERTTDYPGPVVAPGAADVAADGLLRALLAHETRPRSLIARDQRDGDGFADALLRAAAATGMAATRADDEPVAVLTLPASVADWRSGLRGHARRELARKRRRLARDSPGSRLRTSRAATLGAGLDAFCRLHRRAPQTAKAGFLTPSLEAFVREVAEADATSRLDVLEDGHGRPLAIALGFQGPRTFWLYNMAFEPGAAELSPGILLVAALVERAIDEGRATFDFLRGLERYKLELGARPQMLHRVAVTLR